MSSYQPSVNYYSIIIQQSFIYNNILTGISVLRPRHSRGQLVKKSLAEFRVRRRESIIICFLPRHVRGRKHFARSERRIVRYQRTTEAQNAAKLSRKSGKATFSTVSAAAAIDYSGCFLCSGATSRKVSIPRRTVSCSGNAPLEHTHLKRYAFARLSCKTPCGIINHRK